MQIEYLDPRTLTPHPRNPRRHPQEQRQALVDSLNEFGHVVPLVFNRRTGHILDGHLRRAIEIDRNSDDPIPVSVVIDAASPNHIMSGSKEERTEHPTQKPVECFERLIRNHAGDVYDPFLGSGTTLVACERLGRIGHGIEINPAYVAVTLERLSLMGLTPRRI